MPRPSSNNLFFKKSLTKHLAGSGSDHNSENSRTSTPTVSEDEGKSKAVPPDRPAAEHPTTERSIVPEPVPVRPEEEAAADERAARKKAEIFQQALNDSAAEAESSSSKSSTGTPDSRHRTTKRSIKRDKHRDTRGYGGSRGSFRKDRSRGGGGGGYSYARSPHRGGAPAPPVHMMSPSHHHMGYPAPFPGSVYHVDRSHSPHHSDHYYPPHSPHRSSRHSEGSSCGSPHQTHHYHATPPHSPRRFYESPVGSPHRHGGGGGAFYAPPPRMMPEEPEVIMPGLPFEQYRMEAEQEPYRQEMQLRMGAGMGPAGMGPAGMGPAGMGPGAMGPGAMGPAGMGAGGMAGPGGMGVPPHQITPEMMNMMQHMMMQQQMMLHRGSPDQAANAMAASRMAFQQQQAAAMMGAPGLHHPPQSVSPIPPPQPGMMGAMPHQMAGVPPHMLNMMAAQMGQHQMMAQGMPPQMVPAMSAGFPPQMMQPGMMQQMPPQPMPGQMPPHQQMPGAMPPHQMMHPDMMQMSQQMEQMALIQQQQQQQQQQHQQQQQQQQPQHQGTPVSTPPQQQLLPPPQQLPPPPPQQSGPPREEPPAELIPPPRSEPSPPQSEKAPTPTPTPPPPPPPAPAPVTAAALPHPPTTPNRTVNTPGILRLPPQLPTTEELLKSPGESETPVKMKPNYWQKRERKGSREQPTPTPPLPPVSPPPPADPTEDPIKLPPAAEPAKTPPPSSTSPESKKPAAAKPKSGFNLTDLSELVSSSVKHNENMQKTDISRGNVEIVLSQNLRSANASTSTMGPAVSHTRTRDTWRPAKPKPTEGNWREGAGSADIPDPAGGEGDDAATTSANTAEIQQVLRETQGMSTGESIQYALERMGASHRTTSESSGRSVERKEEGGAEDWYNESDDEQINFFELTI